MTPFGTSHASFCDALLERALGHRADSGIRHQRLPFAAWRGDRRLRSVAVGRADEDAPHGSDRRVRGRGDEAGDRRRGRSIPPEGDDRTGVVLGTWTAGGGSTQIFLDALFRQGVAAAPALLFDSTVANSAASIVGLDHRLRGPNMTVSHKEASGLAAIVDAVDILREGRASALDRRRDRRGLRNLLQGVTIASA